jgi:hypothetical protein
VLSKTVLGIRVVEKTGVSRRDKGVIVLIMCNGHMKIEFNGGVGG